MNPNPPNSSGQAGSMLLESLIAILIFSMGILAIVGMQGSAIRATSDAKYRSDASMLANNLIGQMWVSDRTAATLQTNFQGGNGTDGGAYTAWYSGVQTTLPGAGANPPSVTVSTAGATAGQVSITINWNLPGETPHNYAVVAQIK